MSSCLKISLGTPQAFSTSSMVVVPGVTPLKLTASNATGPASSGMGIGFSSASLLDADDTGSDIAILSPGCESLWPAFCCCVTASNAGGSATFCSESAWDSTAWEISLIGLSGSLDVDLSLSLAVLAADESFLILSSLNAPLDALGFWVSSAPIVSYRNTIPIAADRATTSIHRMDLNCITRSSLNCDEQNTGKRMRKFTYPYQTKSR